MCIGVFLSVACACIYVHACAYMHLCACTYMCRGHRYMLDWRA